MPSSSTHVVRRHNSPPPPVLGAKHPKSSPTALYCKQLRALLWKCCITRRRHYISMFFEIFVPILLPLLFIQELKSKEANQRESAFSEFNTSKVNQFGPITHFSPNLSVNFKWTDFYESPTNPNKVLKVYFTPDNPNTAKLVASLRQSNLSVIGKPTEELLRYAMSVPSDQQTTVLGGIVFNLNTDGATPLSYTILLVNCTQDFEDELTTSYPLKGTQAPNGPLPEVYWTVVKLIAYVNRDFVRTVSCGPRSNHNNNCSDVDSLLPSIDLYQMPYPEYHLYASGGYVHDSLVAVLLISYVMFVPLLTKRIIDEKAGRMKELLRLMGMSDFVFWSSHFCNYFFVLVIQCVLLLLIMTLGSHFLLAYSSWSLLLVYLLLFAVQLVLFTMALTTVFNRPIVAVMLMVLLWIVAVALINSRLLLSNCRCAVDALNQARRLCCLLPMGSLQFVFAILGDLEHRQVGFTWATLASDQSAYHDLTGVDVLVLMVVSCPLYMFLIFYLDNVWPFQAGIPRSPLFLFKQSYWVPRTHETMGGTTTASKKSNTKIFEPEPTNLQPTIELRDVCKQFGLHTAVDHLSLNIYPDQLTVLLGHNGAGKSTAMNMITGMFPATTGSITVNAFNVFTDTTEARRSVGLCPQDNVYFNELTVGQHLTLFALLKDFPGHLVAKEVNYTLDLLALQDKKNVLPDKLSGGMKRKLALGIALVGNTDILILDEPTSGMDPEARRVIWDLLIGLRRCKTVLLTTHYMEEADVLGDRIAIMNEGKLRCTGSPIFLKNAYGTGYRLRIAKLPNFRKEPFLEVLRAYVSQADFVSEVETEVVFGLQGEKACLQNSFPKLFAHIEQNKASYGIESCGLSYTTLEDVFLAVGSNVDFANKPAKLNTAGALLLTKQTELLTGVHLLCSQVCALFVKRFNYARRYWQMFVIQLVVPALLVLVAMLVHRSLTTGHNVANATLVLNTTALYGQNITTFYAGASGLFADFKSANHRLLDTHVHQLPSTATVRTINQWLLDQANQSLDNYIRNYVYGLQTPLANDSHHTFQAWFNNEQYHSMPLSVVDLFETLFRSQKSKHRPFTDNAFNVSISVITSPERSTELGQMTVMVTFMMTALIFMPLAFPFLGASYVMFPTIEQVSKSKLLQLITSLSPTVFWTVNLVFDLATHLVATALLMAVIGLFDRSMFTAQSPDTYSVGGSLFTLIFAFGVAAIPVAYALSYHFKSSSHGFVFLVLLYLLFGIIFNMIFVLLAFFSLSYPSTSRALQVGLPIVRFVPIFSFLFGFDKVYILSLLNAQYCPFVNATCLFYQNVSETEWEINKLKFACCPELCRSFCINNQNPFSLTNQLGAGIELIYLFVVGLVVFVGILIHDSNKLKLHKLFSCSKELQTLSTTDEAKIDSDVLAERKHVSEEVANNKFTDLLAVHLSKRFGTMTAVNDLTFGVRYDECFGFLGVNGAGKTTTFSMLTADEVPSAGNAYLNGTISLVDNTAIFLRHLGYCPQFDALLDRLTGDETLHLFARLRGIPSDHRQRDVDQLVRMVSLEEHRAALTATYSGGTKRKLSIAIALLGSPSLVLLDEPSAGVDPASRRKIWTALGSVKRSLHTSIVLTSHSMEECEALCGRVAILVDGRLQCVGATQHLRTKFGQGYSITVRLARQHESDQRYVDEVKQALQQRLPTAVLADYHNCLLYYHVAETAAESWSHLFVELSALNQRFGFEDYFVADTTLEQIFITFARQRQHK